MRIVSQDSITRDDLAINYSLSIVVKKLKKNTALVDMSRFKTEVGNLPPAGQMRPA